jgi:hypothetical protein
MFLVLQMRALNVLGGILPKDSVKAGFKQRSNREMSQYLFRLSTNSRCLVVCMMLVMGSGGSNRLL